MTAAAVGTLFAVPALGFGLLGGDLAEWAWACLLCASAGMVIITWVGAAIEMAIDNRGPVPIAGMLGLLHAVSGGARLAITDDLPEPQKMFCFGFLALLA